MRRALVYSRQSDTHDAGEDSDSLRSQEHELAERARREGWRVVATLREPDRRGWQDETRREVFAEVLRRAAAREYDVLLFWELSRFARSVRLQEHFIHLLAGHGVEVCSHTEPWVSSSPMFRQILGAVAEERTREIARHTRRTIHERARRGLPHGVAPIGYRRAQPRGPYVPVPEEAELVRLMFALRRAGATYNDVARELNRRGVPCARRPDGWIGETVARILANRAYLGEVVVGGTALAGAHEAIVDRATWDAVAALREDRHRRGPRAKPHPSWLEGLVEHACGRPMYLMRAFKPGENDAFRCALVSHRVTRHGCGVPRRRIADWMAETGARWRLAEDLAAALPVAAVLAAERAGWDRGGELAARRLRELADRRRRAEERRARAEDLYLSGARDRAWLDVVDAEVAAEVATAAREEAALPRPPDPDRLAAAAAGLVSLRPVVLEASGDRLREVLRELGVAVVGEEGVRIRYREPYARFLVPD